MYYSAQTGGFYDAAIHGAAIPADAVTITADEHAALIAAQYLGQRIVPDNDGHPIAVDPPPPSFDELMAALRIERDRRLAESDTAVLPDRWENYAAEQRAAWSTYRQTLRDLPEITKDPANPVWPMPPAL